MELMPLLKSLLRISLGLIIAVPLLVYPFLYFFQDKLVFVQVGLGEEDLKRVRARFPDAEVRMTAPDGVELHGWFVNRSSARKAPLIIYFGGNAEEVSGLLHEVDRFGDWAVLLMNYRGYGLSGGRPSERHLFEDALFLYDAFSARNDIDKNRIIAMGRSLGTGVAVHLAARRTLKGLILVSPYDSIRSVAQEIYPWVPVSLLLKHHFDSMALAPSIEAPVLALVASEDRVVSPSHSEKLLAGWRGTTYETVIPGAGHNNIDAAPQYWESIRGFLHKFHLGAATGRQAGESESEHD